MGVRSKIETHQDRAAIEAALARRVPLRKIGKRYGLTIDALHRYKKRLLRDAPELFEAALAKSWKVSSEELEALRIETADGWLHNIRADLTKIMIYRDRCIAAEDDAAAARWTTHIQAYFSMIGKAVDQLKAFSVTNITNNFIGSPDYWAFQRAILGALADHPAARAAVLSAIERIDDERGPPMIDVSPVSAVEIEAANAEGVAA